MSIQRMSLTAFRILNLALIFIMAFGSAINTLAAPSPSGATIASDQVDYPPGGTVILTGQGWASGEIVDITANDDAGQTWSLTDKILAGDDGAFTYSLQLPNWFVATYSVTASGPASGTATTTFTDNDTYDWSQCKNDSSGGSPISGGTTNDDIQDPCGWVNGNLGASNSIYTEGDVVPQRAIRTVATAGSHSITLDHGFFIGGQYTYDFFATPDYTQKSLLAACNDVPSTGNFAGFNNAGCLTLLGAKNVLPIPDEAVYAAGTYPHVAAAEASALASGVTRNLWMSCGYMSGGAVVSAPCTGVNLTVLGHGGSNGTLLSSADQIAPGVTSYTQLKIDFTTVQPDSFVVIWVGGHLAQTSFWNALTDAYKAQGAAFASGSSFHERIIADETGSVGNRDNQLQSGVVVPPGNITIVKDDLTNSSTPFAFTANSPLSPASFNLCDPATATCFSSQAFNSLPTGTYTVNELTPSGWTLSSIVCTVGTSSYTTTSTGTTINLQPGDNATCTFTNSRDNGSLKLSKSLSGGPQNYTGPFTIHYDCGLGYTGDVSVDAGSFNTVSGIPSGTSCTVSEPNLPAAPDGYTFGTPTFSPSATVTVSAGAAVEVTTNNTLSRNTGALTIAKTLSNPDGASVPASFTINYDCGAGYTGSVSVAAGGSATVSGIPTGSTCTVSEPALTPIPGYTWGTPSVTPASVVIADTTGAFTLTVANSITRDRGALTIAKTLSNPDGASVPASFTINYDCGTGYTGSVSVAAGGSATVSGIPTGNTCTVSEAALTPISGYTWGTPSVTPASVVIADTTGTFTLTVANSITRDRGALTIAKTLSNPDGASVPASFTINYDCGAGYTGSVSVAAGGSATVSGIPTGNTCTVSEPALTPISGYTWGMPAVTPASVVIANTTSAFTLTVANSITRDRGTLTIVKKVINDNGGTATVNAFGLTTTAGNLSFDSGVANGTTTTYTSQKITVVTGNYSLKENDVYGYTEGTWSCTNGTANPTTYNGGSVSVDKDKDVVCTIVNNDQPGTIIVIKNAKPAQGTFAFTTTGSGYTGFNLTGATTGNGNVNSQTLNAGTYTVKEGMQLGWYLTGIGGSTDPNTPYNCVVTGSGGSTGAGNLGTAAATISLKNGDTVTCMFENTGLGATRTQGFWATHPQLAQIAWFGGSAYGHTFPGVAATTGIGDRLICGRAIEGPGAQDISKLMGGFWSDISKTSTGAKRTTLDQSRMQLLQQLLSAELNASAFGSVPSGGSGMFGQWETALCGTNTTAIQNALKQAAAFNTAGDSSTFTPGTSADSKYARTLANIPFWDVIKP